MSKLKGLAWLGLAAGIGVIAAVGLPRLARHIPWSVERRLASLGDGLEDHVLCKDASGPSGLALAQLVRRLYPLSGEDREVPISIEVVKGETVNAFATLGGRIYVYDGLLQQAQSPEELAGVLAHEMEHVRQRHIIQGLVVSLVTWGGLKAIFQTGDNGATHTLLSLSFSREQEGEADEGGLERLRSASIDASGFARFFERARKMASAPAILSSHPSDEDRAARAARFTGYPTRPVLTEEQWRALRAICKPQAP
ncbi:MAG: M48 family metallopeptidase [Steroidobacteraceae bacterium]